MNQPKPELPQDVSRFLETSEEGNTTTTTTTTERKFLDIYLARFLETLEKANSLKAGSKVLVGLEVQSEIYDAFLKACPWRRAGETLNILMATYVAMQQSKREERFSDLYDALMKQLPKTVKPTVKSLPTLPKEINERESNISYAERWLDNWEHEDKATIRRYTEVWIQKDPSLRDTSEFQQVLERLGIREKELIRDD